MTDINLASRLESHLPPELLDVLRTAAEEGCKLNSSVYLVGGTVRDLLLGRPGFDLDLVVEGDALALAGALAEHLPLALHERSRFGTAKLGCSRFTVDIAMARGETYARPGALPDVVPGNITQDLARRDFTVNAIAINLTPEYGKLVDPCDGAGDIQRKLIKVLHARSFHDDATRTWRALRYEQRLGFTLESETLQLVQRDRGVLDTISGDRLRHELELVLEEESPEKVMLRADELGVLQMLNPALRGDAWLASRFVLARQLRATPPLLPVYLGLLAYRLDAGAGETFLARLKFPRSLVHAVRQSWRLRNGLHILERPGLRPSAVYSLLSKYSMAAIHTNRLATESPLVRDYLNQFLKELRHARIALSGDDLARMGVERGPAIGRFMERLLEAKLDGVAVTREHEETLAKEWLTKRSGPASR